VNVRFARQHFQYIATIWLINYIICYSSLTFLVDFIIFTVIAYLPLYHFRLMEIIQ